MPTVPSTPRELAFAGPQVSPTFFMIAAANMHKDGRLFEDRAKETQDAIASGEFDPSGMNYTDFKAKNDPRRAR